jgi:hypothetical protein
LPVSPAAADLLQECAGQGVTIAVGRRPLHPPSPALIVVDARVEPDVWMWEMLRARRTFQSAATVVIPSLDRRTILALLRTAPDEVVWEEELHLLGGLIRRTLRGSLRRRLAALLTVGRPPGSLPAQAVWLMLTAPGAPRSVASLARCLHVSERSLRMEWRRAGLPGSPRALLDWQLVCALAEAQDSRSSLEALARRLDVDGSTLYRAATRLLSRPPSEATPEGVIEAARSWIDGDSNRIA